jgi:large subunit ribosomal protein L25
MEVKTIEAQHRSETGKGVARKLRSAGRVPAICYGRGSEALAVAIDPVVLKKSLDPARGFNTVLKLKVVGGAEPTEKLVLVRDYQVDPIRREFQHVDFIVVREDEPAHVEVPVVLTGKAPGVKDGGILQQLYRKLDLYALPFAIPEKISVDVSALLMGQSIHLGDLKLPEGVKSTLDPRTTICAVVAPKEEKVAAEAEVVAAEGVAAPGAAAPGAAAPAAGAKPAPGAAPAPAAAPEKAAKPAAKK